MLRVMLVSSDRVFREAIFAGMASQRCSLNCPFDVLVMDNVFDTIRAIVRASLRFDCVFIDAHEITDLVQQHQLSEFLLQTGYVAQFVIRSPECSALRNECSKKPDLAARVVFLTRPVSLEAIITAISRGADKAVTADL